MSWTVENVEEVKNHVIKEVTIFNNNLIELKNEDLKWDTYIEPELVLQDKLSTLDIIFNMSAFHQDKKVREKCSDGETELSKFTTEQNMRKDLFLKFKYYYENGYQTEKNSFSFERQKYVEDALNDYKRLGMYLDDESYEKVKNIRMELSELTNKFDLNLNNENSSFVFTHDQLNGMEDVLNFLEKRKKEDGTYEVTLKYPDYSPIMEYCKVRETRKFMAEKFNTRCVDENLPICLRVFKLREDLCKLLGYSQYSDYVLEKRMAKTTENVMKFLTELKTKAKDLSKNDLNKLSELALVDSVSNLQVYDVPYYSRIYTEKHTDLNEEELKTHFPLDTVLNGMFDTYQTLFSYKFNDVSDFYKHTFWHTDVKLYEVKSTETNELVGHFYIDLYPREGKFSHAAVFPFVTQSKNNKPIATLLCNFGKDENLCFGQVETLFHEFGHVMHGLSSNVEISAFGGTQCETDFVEAPSQMLEEFCYRPNILYKMSVGLTDEHIEKILKKRNMLQGYYNARQLTFGLYDMMLHSKEVSTYLTDDKKIAQLYDDVMYDTVGLHAIENTNMIASFGHIMHGYESGYYGYMYSKVFAKDIFTKFENHELDSKVGSFYKKEILSYGGSRSSYDSLTIFLGREPNNIAFIKSFEE